MFRKLSSSESRSTSLRLSFVIPALMIVVTVAACAAVGVIGYMTGKDGLQRAAEAELGMVITARSSLLESKLKAAQGEVVTLASSVGDALNTLGQASMNLAREREEILGLFQVPETVEERAAIIGTDQKTIKDAKNDQLRVVNPFKKKTVHHLFGY